MTEQSILDHIRYHFHNLDYKLHNVFIFDWESDFFGITKSGYSIEIEVKTSRSDFFADFKKSKHCLFNNIDSSKIPNRFYYAVPKDLVLINEVPNYAGLIYIDNDSVIDRVNVVRKAKLIHKVQNDLTSKLLSKYYSRTLKSLNELRYINHYDEDRTKENIDKVIEILK